MRNLRQSSSAIVLAALLLDVPVAAQGSAERLIREARARSNAAIAARDPERIAQVWMDNVQVVSSTSAQTAGRAANRQRFAEQFGSRPSTGTARRW